MIRYMNMSYMRTGFVLCVAVTGGSNTPDLLRALPYESSSSEAF